LDINKKEIPQEVFDKIEKIIKESRKTLVETIGEPVFLTLNLKKYM
jgi:hypothetical protein